MQKQTIQQRRVRPEPRAGSQRKIHDAFWSSCGRGLVQGDEDREGKSNSRAPSFLSFPPWAKQNQQNRLQSLGPEPSTHPTRQAVWFRKKTEKFLELLEEEPEGEEKRCPVPQVQFEFSYSSCSSFLLYFSTTSNLFRMKQ